MLTEDGSGCLSLLTVHVYLNVRILFRRRVLFEQRLQNVHLQILHRNDVFVINDNLSSLFFPIFVQPEQQSPHFLLSIVNQIVIIFPIHSLFEIQDADANECRRFDIFKPSLNEDILLVR